jgi:cation/acetate symporter
MTRLVLVAASTPARGLTIGVFLAVLAVTLGITFWAARGIRSATDFWSAGRGISGAQNGMAIAGEFLSAAAFLGVSGLMFLSGFDGYLTGISALLSFVPLLLLLAERMRNAGRYTMADVLGLRLAAGRVRVASAISTMCIAALYVVAQSVAAGSLIEALVGIPYWASVLITATAMLTYVVLGGMVATTWVQIIKAMLLMLASRRWRSGCWPSSGSIRSGC